MVLAMNIGNTNLSIGLMEGGYINATRYPIDFILSQDGLMKVIRQPLAGTTESVTGVIISSVNPNLTEHLENAAKELFAVSPLIVNTSMRMKLNLSCYDTGLIGSDRIVVCEAAISKYDMPLIVFDFGTATTINVVDGNGRFIGGSILPGLMMGINALAQDTAQLPHIELTSYASLAGRNTQECISSGAIFGNAALVDGMSDRIEELLGQNATVIITGGNANYVIQACQTKAIHSPDLLLEGLYILYQYNIS